MNKVDFSLIQLEGVLNIIDEGYMDNYFYDPIEIDVKNKELSSLYAWRNGNKVEQSMADETYQLCSFGYFLPYQFAKELVEADSGAFQLGKKRLFPIVSNLKGDYLLVDIDRNSPVYIISPSLMIVEPEIIYKSLDVMLLSFSVCFEKKAYQFIDNRLAVDDELEKQIVKKYDDSSLFWNE